MDTSIIIKYCNICEKLIERIEGPYCLACLNAMSIIDDGLDIQDQGLEGPDPEIGSPNKLRLLIRNGWHIGN